MEILSSPHGYDYNLRGLFYFEVLSNGTVNALASDKTSINNKTHDSLYSAYFRALNNESVIYYSFLQSMSQTTVCRIDDLEDFAECLGFPTNNNHEHIIHAKMNSEDDGHNRTALVDIEFACGCTLCNSNKRSFANFLKDKYGWIMVLDSVKSSEPRSKLRIGVQRNSLTNTKLPF